MSDLAVVTGGGGGIGREAALQISRRGEAVSIWDKNLDDAEFTAELIRSAGGRAIAFGVDVTEPDDIRKATQRSIEEFGPVSVLVTAAGFAKLTDFLDLSLDLWTRMLTVHATGTFICAQAVAPSMIEARYGRMVFMSSVAGLSGNAGSVHYAAAKAAIIGFGKALAKELGPFGITVNSLAPGAIDTPMLKLIPQRILDFTVNNPMGRVGTPDDVARAVLFLTDRASDFITGDVMNINGGAYI